MARLNESMKKEDKITTHPFYQKHFAGGTREVDHGDHRYPTSTTIHTSPDGNHFIEHERPSQNLQNVHKVLIRSGYSGPYHGQRGYGEGKTAHEAMNTAIEDYKQEAKKEHHDKSVKPLTESLVGKKPATASKLFAEAMEARLDEISKKMLGSYAKKAVADRDELHGEANRLRDIGDQLSTERKARPFYDASAKLRKKHVNRTIGINKAIDKLTKEDLDEVEAPANFWNAGMARMNPIQVSQKQPAEPGQFKATLTKSPKRLADQDSSLEGKPRAVRDETETVAASRGPKTIELTGDWHADVPDHEFDPKLDSETEFYPLFSQFKAMGAYPSGPARAWESEEIEEDELNEISKKTLGRYIERAANSKMMAGVRSQEAPLDSAEEKKQLDKIKKRSHGIARAVKKLTEDSASLMATATKDEKKAAEQDKKKPVEFKKLHDKHEAEVKSKMKELGEEALDEGLFDPAKQPLLALWDEHARRADAHGSGSRNEILKRIEDHVVKKHGQEGLKKMKLHTDLTNALNHSLSPDKGHLQAILGNMRAKCAIEQ